MHSEWEEISNHEVVSMEKIQSNIKLLVPPKKVTLYCSHHEGMKLDLYCETCGELICLHCTVNKHCRPEHKYDLVGDTFQRHKAEITASLEPIEKQVSVVCKALEQYGVQSQGLDELEVAMEANIGQKIQQHQEILEARKAELVGEMKQLIQTKRKNLAAQKDEMEIVHTQLVSCLSFVRESLRTGSQGEVMKMKKALVKQINDMTNNFKLSSCEPADVKFIPSSNLAVACKQFGKFYLKQSFPGDFRAVGRGLELAEVGERSTAVLHVVDQEGRAYKTPIKTLTCELEANNTDRKIECLVRKTGCNQYEISYQATIRGRHQLHIKVEGEHIKGSPFSVTVIKKLGTPIKIISGVKEPCSVAVTQGRSIIIGERGSHCLSIFCSFGEKHQSIGSRGSRQGLLNNMRGIVVDNNDNIIVMDRDNDRIQKFAPDGKLLTVIGKKGNKPLEFDKPRGVAINPLNMKIYVTDLYNHRIQILNPDFTFFNSFGQRGIGIGLFQYPSGVACDSTGNIYVADENNNRIQVFTAEGGYLRTFGQPGKGRGELHSPTGVCIDVDNVVYVSEWGNHRVSVFTCEGKFLTSFGSYGNGPGLFNQPYGITVDKDGNVYVCDTGNNRLQIF